MRLSKLIVAAGLLTAMVAPAFSQDARPLSVADRTYIENIRFLCSWAKTNAPPGNPVSIRVCAKGAAPDPAQAEKDSIAWWNHWRETDNKTWERLASRFDAALQEFSTRKERAAAEEAKRLKAEALIKRLPRMAVQDLCDLVRKGTLPEAYPALVRRQAFPDSEIGLIGQRQLVLGMSEDAMLCMLGYPEDSHRSVGSWGVHTQYVYGRGHYVYVKNGKVDAWQD